MTPEDMLALLDIEAAQAPAGDDPVKQVGVAPAAVKAPHVLKLDAWARRRGRELLAADEDMAAAVGLPAAGKAGDGARQEAEAFWGRAVADFHAMAYEPDVQLNEACEDGLREDFVRQLMDTQEFDALRQSTVLNPAAAEMAAACFAKQFAVRRAEEQRDRAQGKPGGGQDGDLQTMKAAARAMNAAAQAVGDLDEATQALGVGAGAGGRMDARRVAGVYQRVKSSPSLQRIAKLAGRLRRVAASKQRQKVTHGADEVVGVELVDEVARLVPAEMVKLVDPTFALDTARRLFDRQCLGRETRATEAVGKGPIVVVVDESGSMAGPKIETAKALCLALAWIARRQNRWCCLVSFSDTSSVRPGSMVVLPPKQAKEAELLDWLGHFYNGGTDLQVPLGTVPALWPQLVQMGMTRGKTDMLLVTDGAVGLPPELEKSFLEFKAAEKVRLTCLAVDTPTAGEVGRVCDEVFVVPSLDADTDAVGRVLSV